MCFHKKPYDLSSFCVNKMAQYISKVLDNNLAKFFNYAVKLCTINTKVYLITDAKYGSVSAGMRFFLYNETKTRLKNKNDED